MLKIIKGVLAALFFTMIIPFIPGKAQITDEKDIPKGYTPIYDISGLYAINNNLKGKYILMADIDMSATQKGGSWDFGYGWRPLGYSSDTSNPDSFTGILNGNGHKIYNLNIHGYVPLEYIGLFACCGYKAKIFDLALENICIDIEKSAEYFCGGLSGSCSDSYITRCYLSGNIDIKNIKLIRMLDSGDPEDTEDDEWYYIDEKGTFVGWEESLMDSEETQNGFDYHLKDLHGYTGGLIGKTGYSEISNIYTNININADYSGGLTGDNIDNSNSNYCYVLGKCSGEKSGVICPENKKLNNSSFYYLRSSSSSKYGTGLSDEQMQNQNCFTGFDFKNIWFVDPYSSYPYPQLISCPQVLIKSVKVEKEPVKTKYTLNDKLDLSGGVLKVFYEDNYSAEIPITESMCEYKTEEGIQTVTVDYFGKNDAFEIEVIKDKESFIVTEQISELVVGDTFTFRVNYDGKDNVKFSSSNGKILSISARTGEAKGIKVGTVTVTISAGDFKEEIPVTVIKAGTKKEDSSNNTEKNVDFEMEVGESFKLAVKKISSKKLSSSDKTVVTINSKGKVKAIGSGTATITIKDKSTKKIVAEYIIVVTSEAEPDFEIEAGEIVRVAIKSGYTMKSSDENVVSISGKGKITGVKTGIATVTVYDKMGKVVETYLVKVIK